MHMGKKVVKNSRMVPIKFYADALVGEEELGVGDVCNDAPSDNQGPQPAFGVNVLNGNAKDFAGRFGNDPNYVEIAGAFLARYSQVVCNAIGPNDVGEVVHKYLAVLGGIAF